ncbi:uncharacterized protein LOC117117882 [Anneissia japonica]|uniref:uncharacterized protein LOC117117882 n=1 Tax=Anneissia japonica TaxID=1529436 RepID=UPI001425540E|nr:uncharacterized protein LOC117117882 [Anneissia japonica]
MATRERRPTEKGAELQQEAKFKELGIAWRNLRKESDDLRMFMKENPPVKETQTRHKIWMNLYESFLQANDVYCGTLSAEALEEHIEKWYKKKTLFIEKRKSEAEQWFLTRTEVQTTTMSRASKSSRASQGSSARRIAEAKRLSELKKQSELLRDQQESEKKLKLLEIELQQEKERSAIANEMAKAEAREHLLEEIEEEENNSQNLDGEEVDTQRSISSRHSREEESPGNVKQTTFPTASSKHLLEVLMELRKPKLEIRKFEGNRLQFKRFMRQFKFKIEGICSNDEKMAYLEQYTIGEANKIVVGYSFLDADVGYPAAIEELKRKYGDVDAMANEYIKKVLSWEYIRADDPKGLDAFAVFLKECRAATQTIGGMGVLEYSENLKKILQKLPNFMHDR